ncbi:GntR family transcriptional regulator [Kineococcus rhizosphaerae]|uniref:GntR family transcriptional regulator n=1 Tax=Kineococcus rhizosphaerae TaxID=559628 RepID=A0A2T0QSG2_9ACTN|nr:GntR family transcriptional regulator [Kineococcus rhizosphaerae]
MDLSRGALREHLSQLDSLGVLRRRQGHGSYLDTPNVEFIQTYFMLMRQLGHLGDDEFSEARAMLEEVMAAAAASRVRDVDVEELRDIVGVMVAHTKAGDAQRALQADLDFHSRIYEIVDNPIFNMLNQGFAHVLRDNMQLRRDLAMSAETPAADGSFNTDTVHYEIVNALAARDADAARSAMRRHFSDFSLLALAAQIASNGHQPHT